MTTCYICTMSEFTTTYDKTCMFCGAPFIAKVRRAMYCSKLCKSRALAKPTKKDESTGAWHKECIRCGNTFDSNRRNTRLCPECAAESRKESHRKWREKNPEWQQEWDAEHPEQLRAYHSTWKNKNPDKIRGQVKRKLERRKVKRKEAMRDRALRLQKNMDAVAVRYAPAVKLDQNEFAESLHVIRLTQNQCRCTICGKNFFIAVTESSAKRTLERYAKKGCSPCPYCSETPLGHATSTSGSEAENEIIKLYPNFTLRGIRPDWMDGKEIDLFDPVSRVGIEFHGLYAHSGANSKGPSYHEHKADLAEQAGIQLLQVYESEWVQKRECVLDRIDALLHRGMSRIAARKLTPRVLESRKDREMASRFMDENHIQGAAGFTWGVALMDGDTPVAVCTFKYGTGYAFGGQNASTKRYWELNRYATRLHSTVQGGLSRCMTRFWEAHPEVQEVFSFADRRWTCQKRSAYSSAGFAEAGRQRANYMYTDRRPNHPLLNKQSMRKSRIKESHPEIYAEEKTELQMATELGYYRIYDAGKIKYRIVRPTRL